MKSFAIVHRLTSRLSKQLGNQKINHVVSPKISTFTPQIYRGFASEIPKSTRSEPPKILREFREALIKGEADSAQELYDKIRKDVNLLLNLQRYEFRDLICLLKSRHEEIMADMESLHIPLQIQEYNLLASAKAKTWTGPQALAFLEKLRSEKIVPTYTTYRHLVEGLLLHEKTDVTTAEQLIVDMSRVDKVKATTEEQAHLYGLVSEAHVIRGKKEAVDRLK